MIPLLPEEYFEHELCVQCGSIVYEPYYIHVAPNKTITMCRSCFCQHCSWEGYETKPEEDWTGYCDVKSKTRVCY